MMQRSAEEPDAVGRNRSGMSPVVRQSLGCAISLIGLSELKRVYEQAGDGSGAQATTMELTAMKAQQKAAMDALTQSIASSHDYDNY